MNTIRGHVSLTLEGQSFPLCLTLGALAEIEVGLKLEKLSDIDARLKQPSVEDLIIILCALIRGGGADMTDAKLRQMRVNFSDVASAISDTFSAAGLGPKGDDSQAGKPHEATKT